MLYKVLSGNPGFELFAEAPFADLIVYYRTGKVNKKM
jgi:hypothetical protein